QAGSPLLSSATSDASTFESQNTTSTRASSTVGSVLPDAVLLPGAGEVIASNYSVSDSVKQALTSVMAGKNEAQLVYDAQWEEGTRRRGTIMLDQLDTELKNYKANSIKESIRRGSDDLGDLYLKMGQLNNARKCYTRSRDYCTSQQQEITMCLNVIKIAIFQRAWTQVSAHVTRAYSLSEMRDTAAGISTTATTPTSTQSRLRGGFSSRLSTTGTGRGSGSAGRTPTSTDGTSRILSGAPFNGPSTDSASSRTLARQLSEGTAGSSGGGQSYRDAIAHARTQLAIAAGLVELAARNFRGAVLSFLQVCPDHCESPTSSLVTQSDLAYFVTLCALATFDRAELASQVLGSSYVRLLLEAEPACRDILHAFQQADYAACLGRLNKLSNLLRLDYFLADYVTILCREIRSRALSQYFSPYSSADLNRMAKAFDTTVAELENELAVLIQDGSIKARIDSHKQLLRVLNVDQRCLTFARALRLVDEHKKRTQSMVLRMSLARQKLTCQASRDDSDTVLNCLG
ncbi:COP9 signalosome complex subunit 1, partial [Paragonimus heterotremus]